MSHQILLVIIFTLVIHIVSTLSYSVRIVGIRSRKIAISFALFNIMVLISRTSNSFQAPLLAKWIEERINFTTAPGTFEFRMILLATSIATIIGAFMIPTFQRILTRAVNNFSIYKSIPRLFLLGFTKYGLSQFRAEVKIPDKKNFKVPSRKEEKFPWKILVYNVIAVAILTVGVLSSLYAGFLAPELRVTASTLSSIVNGFATIMMVIFIDPHLSGLTDDVMEGKYSEVKFRKIIRAMVFSRLLGTFLAQLLFVPFAQWIVFVARII